MDNSTLTNILLILSCLALAIVIGILSVIGYFIVKTLRNVHHAAEAVKKTFVNGEKQLVNLGLDFVKLKFIKNIIANKRWMNKLTSVAMFVLSNLPLNFWNSKKKE